MAAVDLAREPWPWSWARVRGTKRVFGSGPWEWEELGGRPAGPEFRKTVTGHTGGSLWAHTVALPSPLSVPPLLTELLLFLSQHLPASWTVLTPAPRQGARSPLCSAHTDPTGTWHCVEGVRLCALTTLSPLALP